MKYPLLVFVGPTAAGKTAAALAVIKELQTTQHFTGFDCISADSRQVYQGLEITSGADIPPESVPKVVAGFEYPCYELGMIQFWGVSMIPPTAEWSVAHFRTFVQQVITWSQSQNRLPIIIGGTGLYHEFALSSEPTLSIPPDLEWRKKAAEMTLSELQNEVETKIPDHWQGMNHSDRSNPVRLIRAIEKHQAPSPQTSPFLNQSSFHLIEVGITDSIDHLKEKIHQRVEQRIAEGALSEVSRLLDLEKPPQKAVISATGVKEIQAFLSDQIDQQQLIEVWTQREVKYAKRQLTWWKKYGQEVTWFESDQADWLQSVSQFVQAGIAQTS